MNVITYLQPQHIASKLYAFEKKVIAYSEVIYKNILLAFFISSYVSYFSLFYILPYILEISFFFGALFLSTIIGLTAGVSIALFIKITLRIFHYMRSIFSSAKGNRVAHAV